MHDIESKQDRRDRQCIQVASGCGTGTTFIHIGIDRAYPIEGHYEKGDGIMVIMVRGTRLAIGADISKGIEVEA